MRATLVLMGAGAVALVAVAGTAMATAIPDAATQTCSDKIQNGVKTYTAAVQLRVRNSIKNNIKAVDSKCSAGFACSGGANHGDTCNPTCDGGTCTAGVCVGGTEDGDDCGNLQCPSGQCTVKTKAPGINGHINTAKGVLRNSIASFCTGAQLSSLFGTDGSSRCPDPDSPDNGLDADEIADCLLGGATGDTLGAQFGSTQGDIHARGANEIVPDSPAQPISVCGVTLGSVLQIGSASTSLTNGEAGGAAPLNIEAGCAGGVCNTHGQGIIGNNLAAPTQTFAGLIPVCLVTVTGNSGNGTSQDGVIHIGGASVGYQTSFSPISTTVLIGTTCPVCDAASNTCDTGANAGLPCTVEGGTDVACPPTIVGSPPVIPNPFDLDTEPNSISVPANSPGGGSTNPSGTFCGSCDLDPTIGCDNDADCVAQGVCGAGFGLGCCVFGTNTGAFGVSSATTATANGTRGPYVPQLATIFCTGESGSALVDSTQGLPGPVRFIQEQLNVYEW